MTSDGIHPIIDGPRPPVDGPIQLFLLDGFRLLHAGVPALMPRGLQRIVALVGLRPGASRSQLAGLLWPDVPEERALSSLRTGLWRLRRQLRCPMLIVGDTVCLAPSVEVDVDHLVRTVTWIRDGGDPRWASGVLAIGRHDLLPGWYDEWVLLERERLRQLRLHALEQIGRAYLRAGQHGDALQAALEAMRAEPLRETPHRLIVQVHLAEGNVYEAMHAYYRYRDLMLRELRLEPSTEMRALLDHILPPMAGTAPGRDPRGNPGSVPGVVD